MAELTHGRQIGISRVINYFYFPDCADPVCH